MSLSKKTILLISLLFVFSFKIFAQSSCSKFYPFTKGTSFQITSYDKKGKTSAVSNYVVEKVQSVNNTEVATMAVTIKDTKNKSIGTSNYNLICNNNKVSVDFNSLMNPELFKQFKDLKYSISGKNLEYPNHLSKGQKLLDASIKMVINMNGFNMNITNNIQNRKVIGMENVTTPAGTFNCYVISYTSEIKSMMTRIGTSKQWIAEGIGLVKQEDYNQKGKIIGSNILTTFNKKQ